MAMVLSLGSKEGSYRAVCIDSFLKTVAPFCSMPSTWSRSRLRGEGLNEKRYIWVEWNVQSADAGDNRVADSNALTNVRPVTTTL